MHASVLLIRVLQSHICSRFSATAVEHLDKAPGGGTRKNEIRSGYSFFRISSVFFVIHPLFRVEMGTMLVIYKVGGQELVLCLYEQPPDHLHVHISWLEHGTGLLSHFLAYTLSLSRLGVKEHCLCRTNKEYHY